MTKTSHSRATTLMLVAIAALFTGIGIWFAKHEEAAREEALAPTPVASESERRVTALAEPEAQSTSRAVATEPAQSITTTVDAAAPATKSSGPRVEGRVLDIAGSPVADAAVTIETADYTLAPKLAVSGPDGSFQFAPKRDELRLVASGPNWRTLRSQVWRADHPLPGFLVVAPCTTLKGEVVDQAGAIVPKAMISVQTPSTILAQFPFNLEATRVTQQWSQSVDREGKFNFEGAICAPDTMLEVKCDEYLARTIRMPSDPNAFLRVVLESDPNFLKRTIRGIVVRRNGEPATQAVVRFGDEQAPTDAQGAFALPCTVKIAQRNWNDWTEQSPLVAIEAGSQAAILRDFGRVLKESPQDPPFQKMFLGPPPLTIRGRVLDGERQGLAGYTVTLVDPSRVSTGNPIARTVEQLANGEGKDVKTDAQGAFELGGLFDRRYRLQVFNSKTFGRLESADIPAGSQDVELVFPADAFVTEVSGRVVGRDGSGIGGAKIVLIVPSGRMASPPGVDDGFASGSSAGREKGSTAADGSFQIENIPRYFSEFKVSGKDLVEHSVSLKDLDLDHPLVIQIDHVCTFRIEGLPANKDKLQLLALDAQQNELRVTRSSRSDYASTNRLLLGDDPAEIYSVSEAAVEFVLYATDGTVLGRRPARLVRGSVVVLMW